MRPPTAARTTTSAPFAAAVSGDARPPPPAAHGPAEAAPRRRRPRPNAARLLAVALAGLALLAAACSSDTPTLPPAPPRPAPPPETTTTTAPATTTTIAPPEPPSRPAAVAPPEAAACHPAYEPCLPNLEGDALDCDDIPPSDWPIAIWDPADDPYRLGDGQSFLGCRPHTEPPPQPPPEPTAESGGGEEAAPAGDQDEQAPPEPDIDLTPDEPDEEHATALAASQPIHEPPEVGNGQAPPVGDVGEPSPPPAAEPAPEPESEPAEQPAPAAAPEPGGDDTEPEPEPAAQEPEEGQSSGYVDVSTQVPCVDVPAHDGDRWCTPPPAGDTIQLFSDWGPVGSRGMTRCGYDGYDPSPYTDSGRDFDEWARRCRTGPLSLQVGTIIEDYDTGGRQYRVHTVLEVGDEPWKRLPAWTDVVYPVITCSRWWGIARGYEEHGFLPAVEHDEGLYIAWREPDGRWRLLLDPGMVHLGNGC